MPVAKRKQAYPKKKRPSYAAASPMTRVLAARPQIEYRDTNTVVVVSPGMSVNTVLNALPKGTQSGNRHGEAVHIVAISLKALLQPSSPGGHPCPAVDTVTAIYSPKSQADLIDSSEDAGLEWPRRFNTQEFKIYKEKRWEGKLVAGVNDVVTKQTWNMHQSFGPRGIKCTYGRSANTTQGNTPYTNPILLNTHHLGHHDTGMIALDLHYRVYFYQN